MNGRAVPRLLIAALLPALTLLGIRTLASATWEPAAWLRGWLFSAAVLLLAAHAQPGAGEHNRLHLPPAAVGLVFFTLGSAILYGWQPGNLLGWALLGSVFALLLGWLRPLHAELPFWGRALLEGGSAALASLLPTLLNQIETHFATEEFFAALEALVLLIFWLTLRGAFAWWNPRSPRLVGRAIRRGWLLAGVGVATIIGGLFSIHQYQASFFTAEAPGYPGITPKSPFLCGASETSSQTYAGEAVRSALVEAVAANPHAGAPDYGFLALATGDPLWAAAFREHLLAEAAQGLFTEPAGSVKYGQYLASQRAYFYPRVRETFPGLFSPAEEQALAGWFTAINRRAQTVEWVDWMYALAFAYWPQGPYENQETGAGLLALLETHQLADENLSAANQAYLNANPRGWQGGFRVTDDAAMYQVEWLENAWFQSFYAGAALEPNRQLSFEWLKALALPDGRPLRYNHLGFAEYASLSAWGAALLEDETLLWLAGRALQSAAANPWRIHGQPGAEQPLPQSGVSPTLGTCLLYANSGLPTQNGPLAPDKIVFRSGWEPDSIYALFNLRFSGWHRYKASNTLTQIYQGEPLVIENSAGKAFAWLPIGRSLFRDKRIPRENLNGLQIQKSGLAWALYQLTGIGGPWAQDPPHYAEVAQFETGGEYDYARIFVDDWHGWQHQRRVFFYPEGILVIADEAHGPKGRQAGLTWHLVGEALPEGNRIPLGRGGTGSASRPEAVLLSSGTGSPPKIESAAPLGELPILRVSYPAAAEGSIQTVTIFLFDNWVGAAVTLNGAGLHIEQAEGEKSLPLTVLWQGITP